MGGLSIRCRCGRETEAAASTFCAMAAIAANILVNRNERCVPMSVKPLRFLLAAGAIALIPAAAATQAASEADHYQQLDQLMNVFEKVRWEEYDKVNDTPDRKSGG